MATIAVKDATGGTVYLFAASGSGLIGDPYIPGYVIQDGGNVISVDDNGGSITVDGTVAFSNSNIIALGDTAHDAVDANNPIKIGARAVSSTTAQTPVASGDRTDLLADLDGALIIRPEFPIGSRLSEHVTDTTGNSIAFTTFGATPSQYNYVTAVSFYNSSTTNTGVQFRDGTGGAVLATYPVPALSGSVHTNIWIKTSVNTALAFDALNAVTTLYITIWGAKVKI